MVACDVVALLQVLAVVADQLLLSGAAAPASCIRTRQTVVLS
jgi:hypothetical protein